MKEKENALNSEEQNSEMINSNIFDNLFDNLPNEKDSIHDEAEQDDSLFSGETSSHEESSSDNSLEITYQVGEPAENKESKLTIADVFNISTEEDTLSKTEEHALTIDSVFGKEESLKEKEETISSIQKQLPSITITENTSEEEDVILKPIVSIQDQLPPITITNEDQIVEENKDEIMNYPQTIESIFQSETMTDTTMDSSIQIGVNDESDSFFEEDSVSFMEKTTEEENTSHDNNSGIDYFNYDFKDDIKENSTNQPPSEDQFSFDFYNTIRPQEENQETNPAQEKIEFSKVFAQKETNEDDEKIITIKEDSGDEYRRERKMNEYALYIFYAFLAIVAVGLIIFLIQLKKDFSLSREEITLALRSTYQAEIIANAKVQDNTDYEWTSSNPDIATVDKNGVIAANNKGSATITVKSKKSKKKKTLAVTTIDIIINSIRFEKQSMTVTEGDELTLSPIINDDKTIIMNLEWTSWNEKVVTVDQNGHFIAVGPGETSISVIDPTSNIGTEITITVKAKKSNVESTMNTNTNENKTIAVGKVSLDRANTNMKIGETITVKATVSPSNATNKKVSWSSSNPKVATVKNGEITAVAEGKATITVTTQDGNKKASITVTVSKATPTTVSVQNISLSATSITMKVGNTKTLNVSITPNNASNKHVSWKSESANDAIKITKNTDNQITFVGNKAGEATITVTTHDGKYSATCKVKVVEDTTSNSNPNTGSNSNSNSSSSNSNSNTSNPNSNSSSSNINPDPIPVPDPIKPPLEEE